MIPHVNPFFLAESTMPNNIDVVHTKTISPYLTNFVDNFFSAPFYNCAPIFSLLFVPVCMCEYFLVSCIQGFNTMEGHMKCCNITF